MTIAKYIGALLLGGTVLAGTMVACSSDPSSGGRKGGEGASCLTTNDCKSPLECHDNVCVGVANGDVVDSLDASVADDAPTIEDAVADEGPQPTDLGPFPDYGDLPTSDAAFEVLADYLGEITAPKDIGPKPDLPDGQLNPIGDCESLGISSAWEGLWTGGVTYNTSVPIPGAPPDGDLPVAGDMFFEIQCIDSKLVVIGDMDGTALGQYPFTLKLQGGYNPETGVLKAKMVDGEVILFGIVTVFFEGTLEGKLITPLEMSGTWEGESTGPRPLLPHSDAIGDGEWTASPQ